MVSSDIHNDSIHLSQASEKYRPEDLQSTAAFAVMFEVLSRLHLAFPEDKTLQDFTKLSPSWPGLELSKSELESHQINAALHLMQAGASEGSNRVRADMDKLYGISATALVSPYESVHTTEDGLIFDQPTIQVRNWYARLGLQAPALNKEPDDHLGLELDFLGKCCQVILDSNIAQHSNQADTSLDLAIGFTNTHLKLWLEPVLEKIEAAASTQWMTGLAALTRLTWKQWVKFVGDTQ